MVTTDRATARAAAPRGRGRRSFMAASVGAVVAATVPGRPIGEAGTRSREGHALGPGRPLRGPVARAFRAETRRRDPRRGRHEDRPAQPRRLAGRRGLARGRARAVLRGPTVEVAAHLLPQRPAAPSHPGHHRPRCCRGLACRAPEVRTGTTDVIGFCLGGGYAPRPGVVRARSDCSSMAPSSTLAAAEVWSGREGQRHRQQPPTS